MALLHTRLSGSRACARRWAIGALVAALGVVAGCADDTATTENGLTTARISTASHSMAGGPVLTALALDTYRDEGIAIEDVPAGGSSTNVVSAVLSGDAQFGFVGATTAMDALREGAPIVITGAVTRSLQELVLRPDVVDRLAPVTPESPIRERVEALRGLTIATSPAGSANNTFLQGLLREYGLDPERDVSVTPSEPSAIVAGIRDGLYDGGFWSPGVLEQNIGDDSGELWINSGEDVPAFGDSFQALTITSQRTMSSDPELVERFIRATQAASRTGGDDAAAQDAVYERFFAQLDRRTFDLTWDVASPTFVDGQTLSEADLAGHLELQASLFGGNYDQLRYSEVVHPLAQQPG